VLAPLDLFQINFRCSDDEMSRWCRRKQQGQGCPGPRRRIRRRQVGRRAAGCVRQERGAPIARAPRDSDDRRACYSATVKGATARRS
jgi:hypothetical protein